LFELKMINTHSLYLRSRPTVTGSKVRPSSLAIQSIESQRLDDVDTDMVIIIDIFADTRA